MEHTKTKAPGLRGIKRQSGVAYYWFASPQAVKAGFLPKSVPMFQRNEAERFAFCKRLQTQMNLWLARAGKKEIGFDGTFATLIDRYLTDPESGYNTNCKPGVQHTYGIYANRLKGHIGEMRINLSDGRDVRRWFKVWAGVEDLNDPKAMLPRAKMCLCVLKAAISFGVECRLSSCVEFQTVLSQLEFPSPKSRKFAPTPAHIEAARQAAHATGAASRAMVYAMQQGTTLRQWDIIGVWVPLSDHRISAVISGDKKWVGPTWEMIGADFVLSLTYGKTQDTSAARGVYDLSVCPMVMDEIAKFSGERKGPLIVNEKTGLPYEYDHFKEGWKADFAAAGLPEKMWNRDFRAGAITTAGMKQVSDEDLRKVAGHTTKRQIAQVYDRDRVEAHRRFAAATFGKNKD